MWYNKKLKTICNLKLIREDIINISKEKWLKIYEIEDLLKNWITQSEINRWKWRYNKFIPWNFTDILEEKRLMWSKNILY